MMVGEDDNPQYWKELLEHCRKYDMNAADFMTIIPINFGAGGAKDLLVHAKSLLEFEARPLVGIPSQFESLVLSLRTAVSDNMGRLDKNARCRTIF